MGDDPHTLVPLTAPANEREAAVLMAMLRGAKIHAEVMGASQSQYGMVGGQITVRVPRAQLEHAREIVKEFRIPVARRWSPDCAFPDELVCPDCGYSLIGLGTVWRCPECGAEIPLRLRALIGTSRREIHQAEESARRAVPTSRRLRMWQFVGLILITGFLAFNVVLPMASWFISDAPLATAAATGAAIVVVGAIIWRAAAARSRPRQGDRGVAGLRALRRWVGQHRPPRPPPI
jgi:hypothetical protein